MTAHRGFVFLLAVALAVGIAQGQTSEVSKQQPVKSAPNWFLRLFDDGRWWTTLPDDTKKTFVDGYTTGMSQAYLYVHGLCMNRMHELKPGPQFDA